MSETEIEQIQRFSNQRAEALERMTKERDDLKAKLDVFQKSEVGWLREEYDIVHAKLAQVEADFAEERAKLTHVLTNTTEPGTLPYWQRKHDDLALKAFQLGVKLTQVEADAAAMRGALQECLENRQYGIWPKGALAKLIESALATGSGQQGQERTQVNLTWTSDPPTVPGWYWLDEGLGDPHVVWFDPTWSGIDFPSIKRIAGPIPEPQEPQKESK